MKIQDTIQKRYSVRSYRPQAVAAETRAALATRLEALQRGPFGSPLRFGLAAASEEDRASLRGLGSYGTIKNPAGYIIGAVQDGEHAMEDFGYGMQQAILEATALGLGTCWLGGLFTRSSFAAKIGKRGDEIIPAVTTVGYAAGRPRPGAGADRRLPWEALFFEDGFEKPLSPERAGDYAQALEMVRLGPSSRNTQPWRIIKDGSRWHFYCRRTPGYGKGTWYFTLLGLADLQRIDIGIAMCHFELTARQLGLKGGWAASGPAFSLPGEKTLYIATWEG